MLVSVRRTFVCQVTRGANSTIVPSLVPSGRRPDQRCARARGKSGGNTNNQSILLSSHTQARRKNCGGTPSFLTALSRLACMKVYAQVGRYEWEEGYDQFWCTERSMYQEKREKSLCCIVVKKGPLVFCPNAMCTVIARIIVMIATMICMVIMIRHGLRKPYQHHQMFIMIITRNSLRRPHQHNQVTIMMQW